MEIIGVIVAGIIIGLLGKFVAPSSRDNIPLWLTILCGIGGVILGWYLYTALGGDGSPGIDWVRWLIAVAVAAVLVVIASTLTARSKAGRKLRAEYLPVISCRRPTSHLAHHIEGG
jgi:uncharacterized membrane protein YeaQ/YmgE (transglycosylase-associated protein family)